MGHEYVLSSSFGVIQEVAIKNDSRIYEWEKLFTIRTSDGMFEIIRIGYSGEVESLEVEEGDQVIPGMVLAYIKEDQLPSGSD